MTGPAMTAADTAKVTRQVSRFLSLDPEERNATDVEQIYQVSVKNNVEESVHGIDLDLP